MQIILPFDVNKRISTVDSITIMYSLYCMPILLVDKTKITLQTLQISIKSQSQSQSDSVWHERFHSVDSTTRHN